MFLNSTSLLIWIFDNRFKPSSTLIGHIFSLHKSHACFLDHVSCTQICTCSIFLRKIDKWGPGTLMEAIFLAGCHHSSLADTLFDHTVPLLCVYFLIIISFEKKVFSGLFVFFNCKQKIVGFWLFFFMQDLGASHPLLHWQQWTWTYWASSRMKIGWGRLWRPPHRKVAGGTGSGRSVRKTGHMAPSVTSGCCLSDCFLETDTYIDRQREGERKNWAGYL